MAFQFRLATVLRFRHSLEQREELRLLSANQNVIRARSEIELFESRLRDHLQRQREALRAGISAAELHFEVSCDAVIAVQHKRLQENLRELETARDQQYEVFRKARQQREILENIRDGEYREYEELKKRREQRSMDDAFLLRRKFLRRG
ncbi:MAG TPA: flagellar FliJ family protein [Terriglobales bacterium]|jgi:flagellar export protein FliJ